MGFWTSQWCPTPGHAGCFISKTGIPSNTCMHSWPPPHSQLQFLQLFGGISSALSTEDLAHLHFRISGMLDWQPIRRRGESPCCTKLKTPWCCLLSSGTLYPEWAALSFSHYACSLQWLCCCVACAWELRCFTHYSKKCGLRGKETALFAMLQSPRKWTKIAKRAVHRKKNSNRYFSCSS